MRQHINVCNKMKEILAKYLPENAVTPCFELIKANKIYLKIVNERKTRHGDYRQLPDGQHLITMNATANRMEIYFPTADEAFYYT